MKVENINYTDESGDWYQLADQPTEYNILPLILGIVAGVLLGSLFI